MPRILLRSFFWALLNTVQGSTKRRAGCRISLPGPAWHLLSKLGPPFSGSLYTRILFLISVFLKDFVVGDDGTENKKSEDENQESTFPYFWRIAPQSGSNQPSFLLGIVSLPHYKILPALPDNVKKALEVITLRLPFVCSCLNLNCFFQESHEIGWQEPYVFNPNIESYDHDIPEDLTLDRYLAAFAIKHEKKLHALETHVEYAAYEYYREILVSTLNVLVHVLCTQS